MEYTKILIRYGELSTKGKNKMQFVKKLEQNIKTIVNTEVDTSFDRMFVPYSEQNLEGLKFIFGVQSYSPVCETKSSEEAISKQALQIAIDSATNSFKVSVKRN